jgi:hypothetical protein
VQQGVWVWGPATRASGLREEEEEEGIVRLWLAVCMGWVSAVRWLGLLRSLRSVALSPEMAVFEHVLLSYYRIRNEILTLQLIFHWQSGAEDGKISIGPCGD